MNSLDRCSHFRAIGRTRQMGGPGAIFFTLTRFPKRRQGQLPDEEPLIPVVSGKNSDGDNWPPMFDLLKEKNELIPGQNVSDFIEFQAEPMAFISASESTNRHGTIHPFSARLILTKVGTKWYREAGGGIQCDEENSFEIKAKIGPATRLPFDYRGAKSVDNHKPVETIT